MNNTLPPWQRPQIAIILQIMNGKITNIQNISQLEVNINETKDLHR